MSGDVPSRIVPVESFNLPDDQAATPYSVCGPHLTEHRRSRQWGRRRSWSRPSMRASCGAAVEDLELEEKNKSRITGRDRM